MKDIDETIDFVRDMTALGISLIRAATSGDKSVKEDLMMEMAERHKAELDRQKFVDVSVPNIPDSRG